MCSNPLQLSGVGTKGRSYGNNIIPYAYHLISKEICIHLNGVALFKSIGSNLFLNLSSMNG